MELFFGGNDERAEEEHRRVDQWNTSGRGIQIYVSRGDVGVATKSRGGLHYRLGAKSKASINDSISYSTNRVS